jgi:V8-like Glu-specific endopeptidase
VRNRGGKKNINSMLVSALLILCSLPTQAKELTQAVGTIYCDGGIRGVATHIETTQNHQDHSVIVTAAHVLYNPQTDQLFNQCHYRPQNKRLSGIGFEKISSHSYSVNTKDKIAQAESDLVFIQLKNRVLQSRLKLAQDFSNSESEFSLISSDIEGFKLTRCNKIDHLHLNSEKLVLHNCPVQQGSSGSPLLNASGDVIAVHGGRFTIQTAKDSKESAEWIGQARRIDSKIVFSLDL